MLGLFTTNRRRKPARTRLSFDLLDRRDNPSAPVLDMAVTDLPGTAVLISGQVADDAPGGLVVTIEGAANGQAVTAADGTYSVVLDSAPTGTIDATTRDTQGLASNRESVSVPNARPTVTNVVVTREGDFVTISGTVTDDHDGSTVTFGGQCPPLDGVTVELDENGNFSHTVRFPPVYGDLEITVFATDASGLRSETVSDVLMGS